jgi:hypothetical protein
MSHEPHLPWPTTLDEALDRLMEVLIPAQRDEIRDASNLIEYHLGLDMWIRNQFGLWRGNTALIQSVADAQGQPHGFVHPDSVSSIIIQALQMRLRALRDARN